MPMASWGDNGVLLLDFFGRDDDARSVAILADGKILISGGVGATPSGHLDIGLGNAEHLLCLWADSQYLTEVS
jgi:hypothetical protein